MPRYVVERAAEALDRRCGKGLNGTNILVIGIAYKKNIDDVRKSPGLAIIQRLETRGAQVAFHDPHVPVIPKTREHSRLAGRESQLLTPETVAGTDMVLIITDHDSIDWDMIAIYAPLIIDTRHRITTGNNLELA